MHATLTVTVNCSSQDSAVELSKQIRRISGVDLALKKMEIREECESPFAHYHTPQQVEEASK